METVTTPVPCQISVESGGIPRDRLTLGEQFGYGQRTDRYFRCYQQGNAYSVRPLDRLLYTPKHVHLLELETSLFFC